MTKESLAEFLIMNIVDENVKIILQELVEKHGWKAVTSHFNCTFDIINCPDEKIIQFVEQWKKLA